MCQEPFKLEQVSTLSFTVIDRGVCPFFFCKINSHLCDFANVLHFFIWCSYDLYAVCIRLWFKIWLFYFFVILGVINATYVLSSYLLIGSAVSNGTMHPKRMVLLLISFSLLTCNREALSKNVNSQDMWFSLMETDWQGAAGGMESRLHHTEPPCRRL